METNKREKTEKNKRKNSSPPPAFEVQSKTSKVTQKELIEIPPPTQQEIRCAILYGFRRKLKPVEIFNECQIAYKKDAPSLVTVSKWFRRFQARHFSVEDESRIGRPKSSTNDVRVALVKSKIDENPRMTQEMIANELGLNVMAVSRILSKHLGYTKKLDEWVPMDRRKIVMKDIQGAK